MNYDWSCQKPYRCACKHVNIRVDKSWGSLYCTCFMAVFMQILIKLSVLGFFNTFFKHGEGMTETGQASSDVHVKSKIKPQPPIILL